MRVNVDEIRLFDGETAQCVVRKWKILQYSILDVVLLLLVITYINIFFLKTYNIFLIKNHCASDVTII